MQSKILAWLVTVGVILIVLLADAPMMPAAAQLPSGNVPAVVVLRFEGALQPVMVEHLQRAQQIATRENAQAIILELDTPGGEIGLMNRIIERIRSSSIPVIVYVSPRGAMAGSAGSIITLAGHVAAMAPETAIGAASPVGPSGEDIGTTMQTKVKEMLKATARTLSTGRSAEAIRLSQEMIDTARAVSVKEALQAGLVDLQADDLNDLLRQLNGRQVSISGQTITLHTQGAPVQEVPRSFMENVLMVLANPNVAFLLLAVGVQAILIELSSPGGWVAGFIGVVCLLFATYGLGVLPVNGFGALFLVLAFVLFLLDIKAMTHGALTVAGVGSFIVGALVLFNGPGVPAAQRVSVPLVVGTGLAIGLIFFTIVGFALRAQKAPVRSARQSLVGQTGVVKTILNPVGTVQVGSELWTAVAETPGIVLPAGTPVQVTGMQRLQIQVKPSHEER